MPPQTPEALNAELLARIVELERQIGELQAELARHQTAVQRRPWPPSRRHPGVPRPGIKPAYIRSRRVPHRPPVLPERARTALDLLRTTAQPMTTREMALRLLQEHNLDQADLARLEQAIGGCMNRADGRPEEPISRRKRPIRWRLVG